MLKYHPDRNKSPNAVSKFKKIITAYEWIQKNHDREQQLNNPVYYYPGGNNSNMSYTIFAQTFTFTTG